MKVPRKVAILKLLEESNDGAKLCELLPALGRTDRIAQASVVGTLLQLRRAKLVSCVDSNPQSKGYRRTYQITHEGSAYLHATLQSNFFLADSLETESLQTGAMVGESPIVVRCAASNAPALAFSGPHWAFGPRPVKLVPYGEGA